MTRFRAPDVPVTLSAPPNGRVLVVAPHPDDETMGVGGTLALHRAQGDAVTALFVCNGIQGDPDGYLPREEIVPTRRREAQAAADVLGIGELRFLDYPDNLSDADIHVFEGLPEDPDDARRALAMGFADQLIAMIESDGFDIVYFPWDGELNADHWLIGQAVTHLRSSRPDIAERASWLGYDVWSACIPDTVMDTSNVMETKLAAVHCYESQELYVDYAHAVAGLDAYRSLLLERGATYGEAFVGRYREDGS
ncbi:MAG: hypothetical protein CMJ18_16825 [Phycisphaeraceae bacterium]|nr:hypothetical protein [Phycisphaeraceae bacterium]